MWKNINSTNKRRDLLLTKKPQIIPWRTERTQQRIERHRRATVHRSALPRRVKDPTEKSSYGLGWLQKRIWYGPTKLDNKLPQNVQNIRQSHKPYRENHENLESGIDSRREKLSRSEDPKRYIWRKCTITFTIHNCHDATQSYPLKMHSQNQT